MSAVAASLRLALAAALAAAMANLSVAQEGGGITDLAHRPIAPLTRSAPATVLVFTAADCPISDRYAPEVRRLAARFGAAGVRFWVVYANAGEEPASARDHAATFGYGLPVALDPQGRLADRARASVTPEAAVFDASGALVYHGRIDDRYIDFGVDRPAPTTHDLADAIAATVSGKPVARADVPAVGCAIVRRRP